MRSRTTLVTLVALAAVAGCGGGSDDGSGGAQRQSGTSSAEEVTLSPAGSVAPALCGTTVAAQTGTYGPGPLVIQDLDTGATSKVGLDIPEDAETDQRDGTLIEAVCADTSRGKMFVVAYGRTGASAASDEEQQTAGLFGVSLDGEVLWYTDVPTSEMPVVHGDAVLLRDSDVELAVRRW